MGGGQWQVLYLLERLKEAVLLAPEGSPLLHEARKRGIDARGLSFISLFKAARAADLVHAHDSRAHTMAAIASGTPLVVSRRVGFAMTRGFLSDRKYTAAKMYLAVSKFVATILADRFIAPERIRVVYDGVPIPERASTGTGRTVAIAKTDRDAILNAGVPVEFVSDLWQDLSTARVCVYWSEMEGLGSAALAAMASGVPVIARRVGGLPEAIEHERTGLLVDDAIQLADALRRLTENPVQAAEMGRRARETAIARFSAEAMVQATMRAYEEAVA